MTPSREAKSHFIKIHFVFLVQGALWLYPEDKRTDKLKPSVTVGSDVKQLYQEVFYHIFMGTLHEAVFQETSLF